MVPPKGRPLRVITGDELKPYDVVFQKRSKGLGDLVDILGVIQAYRKQFPGSTIYLQTLPGICAIAEHHPDIDVIFPGPDTIPPDALTFTFTNAKVIEQERRALFYHIQSRIHLYAQVVGIEPEIPRLYLTDGEREWAARWMRTYATNDAVALVWQTTQTYRNYPRMSELFQMLRAAMPIVILEHAMPDLPGCSTFGLTIRQQAAILSHARFIISPDTGWAHVAGALSQTIGRKIPLFGIPGSGNPEILWGPFQMPCSWIQGTCPHGKLGCRTACLPKTEPQPCSHIDPRVVAQRILEFANQLAT